MKNAPLQIPTLDGFRAVAFLMVFVGHSGVIGDGTGRFGVTLFFFLSGYLITTLMRIEQEETGRIDLKHFYLRRALRILPPLYISLAAAVALTLLHLAPGRLHLPAVAAAALHVTNYYAIAEGTDLLPAGTGVLWSLAVEEHFYAVFPLLYLTLSKWVPRRGHQTALLVGLCAAVLAWRSFLVYGLHVGLLRTFMGTDTRIDSILFGCVLAIWGNPALDGPSRIPTWAWKWVLLPAAGLALAFTHWLKDDRLREAFRYSLQGVALVPLFVAGIRFPGWLPFRVLNLRPLQYLGTLSYTLYLMHDNFLQSVRHRLPFAPPVGALVAFALTFAFAWAVYEAVERPCARLRRRLTTARVDQPVPAPGPA